MTPKALHLRMDEQFCFHETLLIITITIAMMVVPINGLLNITIIVIIAITIIVINNMVIPLLPIV